MTTESENDDWRVQLIDAVCESMGTDIPAKEQATMDVGYYYSFCAPEYIYKYYSPSERNIDAIRTDHMWNSSPSHFNDPFDRVFEVEERPTITSIDTERDQSLVPQFLIRVFSCKSKEWSYEKEWRIIRDDGAAGDAWDNTKKGALLPSITPSAIYLGAEAEDGFVKEMETICREKEISLYKMEKDRMSYKLNAKTVLKYDEESDDF